jgi:hypothetical protein
LRRELDPHNDLVLSRGVASAAASNYLCSSRGAAGCSTLFAVKSDLTADHVVGSTWTVHVPLLMRACPPWTTTVVNTGSSQSTRHGANRHGKQESHGADERSTVTVRGITGYGAEHVIV